MWTEVVRQIKPHLWDEGEDECYFRRNGQCREEEDHIANPAPELPLVELEIADSLEIDSGMQDGELAECQMAEFKDAR